MVLYLMMMTVFISIVVAIVKYCLVLPLRPLRQMQSKLAPFLLKSKRKYYLSGAERLMAITTLLGKLIHHL